MKFTTVQFIAAISCLIEFTIAIPLIWTPKNMLQRRAPQAQTYSIVAVDGGNSTPSAPAPATKTVTDAITQIQTATVIATVVATPLYTEPTTIVISQTVTAAVAPSVTSVAYDDGQWKTTYYFRSTVTPQPEVNVAAAISPSKPAPATTATPDVGQWAYWKEKSGNGNAKR